MELIRFSTNKDLMRGIKYLIGKKTPIGMIDGTTYLIPNGVKELLDKNSIQCEKINDKENGNRIEDFKKILLEEANV